VVIGIREVYAAVTALGAKLDVFVTDQAVRTATMELRLTNLEKQADSDRNTAGARADSERSRRWQLYVALLAAFIAIALGVLQIVTR
jgi:hypothetical protein